MMWQTLFSPVPFLVCFIALLVIIYFLYRLPMGSKPPIFYTSHGKLARRLGSFEKLLFAMGTVNNTCYIHTVLLLESKVKLHREHVKKAMLMLKQRFPLLRMRVTVDESNEACFEEMASAQSLDFRSMDVDSRDWQHAFEKQINGESLDTSQGPLWRVALLKETCDSKGKESIYKNTLLFTFHHVICDGLSTFELKKKLIEYLGLLQNGEAIKVESLPFRPPIECTMQHLTTPNILERFLISIIVSMPKLRVKFFKPQLQNLYLKTFSSPSIAHKIHAVPRNLTKEETMALIRCSKNNKCTVHGAITAATHLAMSQILMQNNPSFKTPFKMDTNYTVNIRKECEPKIESEELGLYAIFDALQITVPSSRIDYDSAEIFWEFARACTKTIHAGLDSGKHRGLLKFVQCINVPSFWAQWLHENDLGLSKELFNLTNLGALSIDQEGRSPYKFAGSYMAVQSAKMGFVFGNNIFTVNDRLYWTVEYSPEITSTSQAEELVDLSLRILLDACAS